MNKRCKDCPPGSKRPAIYPGPRCATHWRAETKRRDAAAHGRAIGHHYTMTAEQYQLLYQFQGGVCFICRKAKGTARRLAVEHEHNMDGCEHLSDRGCPHCWRGLVCKRCNRLIAFLDVDALARAIVFLIDPPARRLFG